MSKKVTIKKQIKTTLGVDKWRKTVKSSLALKKEKVAQKIRKNFGDVLKQLAKE